MSEPFADLYIRAREEGEAAGRAIKPSLEQNPYYRGKLREAWERGYMAEAQLQLFKRWEEFKNG